MWKKIYTLTKHRAVLAALLCFYIGVWKHTCMYEKRHTKRYIRVERDSTHWLNVVWLTKRRVVFTALLCCCTGVWNETYVREKRPQNRHTCAKRDLQIDWKETYKLIEEIYRLNFVLFLYWTGMWRVCVKKDLERDANVWKETNTLTGAHKELHKKRPTQSFA